MIADSDDPERVLIQHVLTTIRDRINPAQPSDHAFTQERFAEMAEQLDLAYTTIKVLSDKLHALTADHPPAEVTDALRSHGRGARPVRLTLGGELHTFLVPALGREDPIEEARWWRRITDEYGGA